MSRMITLEKIKSKQTPLAEAMYYLLNIMLVVISVVSIVVSGSPAVAVLLMLASKWRVFAVRPRYWLANIQSNLVDTIVGLGLVLLIYVAGNGVVGVSDGFALQVLLGVLYAVWLLIVKPRSSDKWVYAQALIAIIVGTMALYAFSYKSTFFNLGITFELHVLAMAGIGYAAARHILMAHKEVATTIIALIWAFFMAQIGWITYHWVFAYKLFDLPLKMPQGTLIAAMSSVSAALIYREYSQKGKITRESIVPSSILCGALLVILLFFSSVVQ